MDEEIKEVGEMATIEDEEEITIEEDYTALEAETIIIDDDSNIQTDAEYEQAVKQKELADEARGALSAVLLSVLEKGEINDDDIAEIAAQQEIYTENVTALKILGLTTEDEKTTTNVITSNIDYNELMKVLSEKADWLYIDEDGQVMLNGEVVPKLKVVELEAEKIKADVGEFKNLTTENFTATNATIENLKANKADIEYLNANYATIQNLNATNANVSNLQANKANITDLQATNAKITNLEANKADIDVLEANYATINLLNSNTAIINNALIDKANVSDLNATNANVTNLQATKANITDLNAANANINTLTGNLADITTLVNGNLTSDNIQSMVITGDKFTVANGFIKNAMIDSVNANKINAGVINTNNVSIQSNDGSMLLQGNLQQFKDKNGKVRIQIGKDAKGNFTFCLYDENGTGQLINEKGIQSSNAIADGLIVDSKVADNANIAGSKLDIDSVVTEVNNGTTSIKGTKIYLDDQKQSLNVAFNNMSTTVKGNTNTIQSHTTSINTMNGKVTQLISDTTITKQDGTTTSLKDAYNATVDTVDSHSTKIGSLETNLATANSNISSVSSKQSALEQNLNGFKQTVSETYTTKTEFNNLQVGGRNLQRNTAFKTDLSHWEVGAGFSRNTSKTFEGANSVYFSRNGLTSDSTVWFFTAERTLKGEPGQTYTASANFYTDDVSSIDTGKVKLEIYFYNSGGGLASFSGTVVPFVNGKWVRCSHTATAPAGTGYIAIVVTAERNGKFYVAKPKFEKGNKATDWSPAPEDIDSAITTVDGKFANYSTTSQMNSAINQKANEITSTVSQTYATKTALNTVDGKFANYSTTSQMNSAINQKANEITSTVSETYTTKTEFNNLQVGGRNLQRNTAFKTDLSHWEVGAGFSRNTSKTFEGANSVYFSRNGLTSDSTVWFFTAERTLKGEPGQTYTASANFYTDDVSSIDTGKVKLEIYFYNSGGGLASFSGTVVPFVNGKWVRCSHTATAPANTVYIAIVVTAERNGIFYVAKPKFEKGNKATDWSPAPEDVDSAINTVDGKFANYSTTSQMNSAINQKSDSILSTVSNTYTTKTEFNNLQVGGRNLQRNTEFKNDLSHWSVGNRYSRNTSKTFEGANTVYFNRTGLDYDSENWFFTAERTLKGEPGQTYTASANFYTDDVSSIDTGKVKLEIYFYTPTGGLASFSGTVVPFVNGKWVRCSHTATAPANTGYTAIVITAYRNGKFYVAKPKFEKGDKATDWTPAPEDIDDSISSVDGKFVNYSTTQQMNSAINQKANEITSTVSETYATKSSVTDVSNNLKNNYSTTLAMNSAINQKANEITSTVSETYAEKSEFNSLKEELGDYTLLITSETIIAKCDEKGNLIK